MTAHYQPTTLCPFCGILNGHSPECKLAGISCRLLVVPGDAAVKQKRSLLCICDYRLVGWAINDLKLAGYSGSTVFAEENFPNATLILGSGLVEGVIASRFYCSTVVYHTRRVMKEAGKEHLPLLFADFRLGYVLPSLDEWIESSFRSL